MILQNNKCNEFTIFVNFNLDDRTHTSKSAADDWRVKVCLTDQRPISRPAAGAVAKQTPGSAAPCWLEALAAWRANVCEKRAMNGSGPNRQWKDGMGQT